jgi:hypothetical protein
VSGYPALARAQKREYRKDPPVIGWRLAQPELEEDLGNMRVDRLAGQEERLGDRPVRAALGNEGQNLSLALGQLVEWPTLATR